MLPFRNMPIKRKLMLIIMLTSSAALLLACIAFVTTDLITFRHAMVRDLSIKAEIIGSNSSAALVFNDQSSAQETLSALRAEPHIVFACIYNKDGRVFAKFLNGAANDDGFLPPKFQEENQHFDQGHLILFKPIVFDGDTIGAVYLKSDLKEMYSRLKRYGGIVSIIMLVALCAAFFLSIKLQQVISLPILNLALTTRTVVRDGNYSMRAEKHSHDEIGILIDGFNEMLDQIEDRNKKLELHHEHLEEQIALRTTDLEKANQELRSEMSVRKRAEIEVKRSLSLLEATLESTADGILVVDRESKIASFNQKFVDMWRIPDTIISSKDDDQALAFVLNQLKDPDRFLSKVRELYNQPLAESYDVLEFKDGRIFERYSLPQIIGQRSVGRVWSFRDVTERNRAEEKRVNLEGQLQRAQKMEAIGTLAGGVAHDLNNVLSSMVLYPDLLLMQLPKDNPFREPISAIKDSAMKAAAIVQDLLTLARRGVVTKEVVNVKDIISKYLKSPELQKLKSYHPGVEIEADIKTDLLNITGSPIHLFTTIMNLVSNAVEAITDEGKVCISTENRYIDKPISGYDSIDEGDYIILEVSDNGAGISSEDIGKIFEPFYTKKKMGRSGTGLGMAVVWGTIRDHDGYIDVQSTEGKGTTFTLYFPATRQEIFKEKKHLPTESYMGEGESILVVDDVKSQREIAFTILTTLGYEVDTVSSGEDAVEYLKGQTVDLIVLDMIMDPGIDGLDTYKKITVMHPSQKAIIASGFSETDRVIEAQRMGAGTYVKKPYTIEKIGTVVRSELDKEKLAA